MAHGSGRSLASRLVKVFAAVALPLILAVGLASPAWAQSEAINATIRGHVTDPNGAGVPEATVTAKNVATGYTRTVTTGTEGFYVIPALPLGTYTVAIQKEAFATLSFPGVVLEAGKEAVIDGPLKIGAITTTIEVTGGSPVVEPSRVNIGRTINTREIQNLPLTSRNPYNFILFQPGVSGHPNPELGIPRTVNTNGLMDRINYQMDGMADTQSDRYGLRLFPISNAYVSEVQTVSNSFAAEFGGTAGNIYNVITGSGTNDFHGMFHWLKRPVSTTARPILLPANQPKPELALTDYAVNGAGRLKRDKLFLFAAYEHLRRGFPTPITISPANAAMIGIPSSLLATAPSISHAQFFDVRGDWNITPKHQMFIRYNYFRNNFPFNTAVGGLNAGDASSDFLDRAHVGGMQLLSTFSPHLLNEFRFSWPYRKNTHLAGPLTGPGPQVSITGVANFGGSVAAGDFFAEKDQNWTDNLTYTRGTHTFKTGLSAQRIIDVQQGDIFTQYNFSSISAYLSAKSGANPFAYFTVRASIGDTRAHYISLFWDFFVQDSWQVRPALLVTYGLRYDRFQSPDPNPSAPFVFSRSFRNPAGNLSPRLGVAWRVNNRTVVRASGGVFYDAAPTNLWFNSFSNDGSGRAFIASLSPISPGAPAFPSPLTTATAPGTPDVTSITPDFKNAHTINASLQVSREFTTNDAVSIGYVFTGGRNLLFLHNSNLINPTGTLADGRPIFSSTVSAATRLNPQFNNVLLQDVGANSSYNALLLTYQHRWAHGYQISASYTYSHTISDAPEVNSFEQNLPIEDTTNRLRDRGNSSVNRPHALTISSVLEPQVNVENNVLKRILNDNQFAFLFNISSGDQQNVVANRVLNVDTTTSSVTRPLFVGRNIARGPKVVQIDMRYTRTLFTLWERIRPQFLFEANNILNHPNITSLNTVVRVNLAGQPTDVNGKLIPLPTSFPAQSTVLEGRIIQFGLAVRW